MSNSADSVLDHLGGTSAVAKLIEAPTSTVHSWRKNGIPQSRMAHLRLAARAIGNPLPEDLDGSVHGLADAASQHQPSSGKISDSSTQAKEEAA